MYNIYMKIPYKKRLCDEILKEKLKLFGAVLITGPKDCGKSTTGEQQSKTFVYFQDKNLKSKYDAIFNTNPNKILFGDKPILFDEWQDYRNVWDLIRYDIDKNQVLGGYILTGSSATDVETSHSGTGRISSLKMYPMSLYESGESNGTVSLKELFDDPNKFQKFKCDISYDDYAYLTCRGGWPRIFLIDDKNERIKIAEDLYYQAYKTDVYKMNKNCDNPILARQVFESDARNICTLASNKTIYNDIKVKADYRTIDKYIETLEKLCIIEDIPAWNINIKSKAAIRCTPKRNFTDPSFAAAALFASPTFLADNPQIFGFLFECLVIRDLKIYSGSSYKINYYHDKSGLECDLVLHNKDGKYALIEIKLGGDSAYKNGINSLNKLESLIVEYNNNPENKVKIPLPTFKMVITGSNEGENIGNNTLIIPLGCLKD